MYKLYFPFLLAAFLFAGSSLIAQPSEFLSQLQKIIAKGEKGEIATIKGELFESTRDREEQHRVYSCLQRLTGFSINFSENETYFNLFIVAQRADSAKILIDALLNDETRERSGINGYIVNRENESVTKNVSLQKAGSAVTMTLYEPDSKILIAFTIKVMKTVVPPAEKIYTLPVKDLPFCEVTQLIIKKMKSGDELSMQGIEVGEDAKVYTSVIELKGWMSSVTNDSDGFTFDADKDDANKDIQIIQKQFAEVKAQLISCLAPKKLTSDDSQRFSFSSGTIVVTLLLNKKRFSDDYCLSLYITKPKK